MSMGGGVGRAACVESLHIAMFVHQTLAQAEHTLHFPFLLESLRCHGSNSVGSAFPWHSLTESCL